jgi:hypothetical protein
MARLFLPLVLLMAAMASCGPTVYFEKPQPTSTFNQKSFRNTYHGKFRSTIDSSLIIISRNMIMREGKMLVRRVKSDLDSSLSYRLQKDTLIDLTTRRKIPVRFEKDTVVYQLSERDTLFIISKDKLLRSLRENYFLNYRISENHWYVKRMTFDKGDLVISEIRVPEDINELRNLSEVREVRSEDNPNSFEYLLDPSRKELKTFIDRNGFRSSVRYVRVK